MEVEGRALGPAKTNFNHYVGTVAADDAEAVLDRPSLYQLAKIDRDRYTVLGIDPRVDGSTTASIYAIDRVEHRISLNGTDIVELGESWGEIPVVAQDSRQVDQQEGETIMTLEDMDRDQLAEYELRRLNFSDDNWRIGHNRVRRACTRSAFYELDADELGELNARLRRDASKNEIILWLHKRADEILWNDELP